MTAGEPLRISCEDCPGGTACEQCLVGFILGAGAEVTPIGGESAAAPDRGPAATGAGVPPSLEALDADQRLLLERLHAAGLQPRVTSVTEQGEGVARRAS